MTGIEGHPDDLRTLGDEDAPLRVEAIAQLRFGQGAEHLHSGMVQRLDFYDWHGLIAVFR